MMMHLHQGLAVGRSICNGGGKGSAPPAPDYAGAAQATAQGNLEATRAAAQANRVNQYSPYGSIEWNKDPNATDPDSGWSVTQELSPEQQALFDQNNRVNQQLGNVSEQGVGYVQNALDKPLSFEGMQGIDSPGQIQQAASDAAYANATRYLDPQFQKQQSSLENQLANQGITRGSEAWNNAMSEQNMAKEQAYANARNLAYTQGMSGAAQNYNQALGRRQQQITEAQTLRQDPINMLNAVRTGSQMQAGQMPTQMNVPLQQTAAGADLLGAATATGNYNQGIYNAQQARAGALTSGLFSLGAAALISDPNAKENIIKIGKLDNGMNLYRFEYKPEFKDEFGHGEHIGVMADEVQEVMPEAVVMHVSGMRMVDYGMILNGN